jgi:uncharacterized protein YcbX
VAQGSVVSLWRYPVKSMQGESLTESAIGPRGLSGDRAYALIDVESGMLVSAKHPRKWGPVFACHASFVGEPTDGDPPPVQITLPDSSTIRSDDRDVNDRLTALLGREVRLETASPPEPIIEEVWPEVKGPDFYGPRHEENEGDDAIIDFRASLAVPGGFFDLSAIHLVTTNSLDALTKKEAGSRFDERRFRPNIVVSVDGDEGFVENDWGGKQVRVGDALLAVAIPTPRCVMTTLANDDLPKDNGVLKALADHNRVTIGSMGSFPCLGVNASVSEGGTIRRGDAVAFD